MSDWKKYETRRAVEVEQKLIAALDAKDFEAFKVEYREHALRYLTKKRRQPLYQKFSKEYREVRR